MMLRKRSNRWASLKAFGFLPLAALILSAFARPEVSAKTEALTGNKRTENVSDKDAVFQKEIIDQPITVQGDSKDSSKATIRVRPGSVSDKELADCMVVIDGKEAPDSKKALSEINKEDIASIDILKDKEATASFGEKGKKGVILITTKKGAMKEPGGQPIVATAGDPNAVNTIRIDGGTRGAGKPGESLLIIDGVEYDLFNSIASDSIMKNTNPADIASLHILKDSASTAIYGERGKRGVVIVTTKKGALKSSGAKITATAGDPNAVYTIPVRGNASVNESNENGTSSNDQDALAYAKVETPPAFPGGEIALLRWISKNVQYPEGAKARGEAGRVTVSYIINKDGKVVNGKIERGVSTELDQEALRIVSIMPNWTPGKLKGEPVDVKYVLPVSFKLSGGEGVKPSTSK